MIKILFNSYNKQCYLMILLTIITTFIKISTSINIPISNYGAMNIFLLSTFFQNNMMKIFAPIIPVIISYNYYKKNHKKYNNIKENIKQSLISSFYGSFIYLFTYSCILILCIIIFPNKGLICLNFIGFFSSIGDKSILLYCIACIVFSTLFGYVYSFFSYWTIHISNNNVLGGFIPIVYYHAFPYSRWLLSPRMSRILHFIFPSLNYQVNFMNITLWQNSKNLLFVIIITLILILINYLKIKIKNLKGNKK